MEEGVPKDYVGSWEKHMKYQSSSTKVSAVGVSPSDDDDLEYPETAK